MENPLFPYKFCEYNVGKLRSNVILKQVYKQKSLCSKQLKQENGI
jgi:hypothetical protein